MRHVLKSILLMSAVALAGAADAAIINGGFESGLTGWSTSLSSGNGAFSSIGSVGTPASSAPLGGATMAVIHSGATGVYQTLWQNFSASSGQLLSAQVRWNGNDYLGDNGEYNDDGYARVGVLDGSNNVTSWITPTLWTADVATWGSYDNANGGNSPWTSLIYSIPMSGNYRIEFGVRNVTDDDSQQASEVFVDNVALSPAPAAVPEPGDMLLMMLGVGALATLRRRRASAA